MAENTPQNRNRPKSMRFDRGGFPAEIGPYVGIVKNNVDPAVSGRLQVYLSEFGGDNEDDPETWRTVNYLSPFYGVTPNSTTATGAGAFIGGRQSYGMWFTPPDVGVRVVCIFINGDPNQGYYFGCFPELGLTHMLPAMGSAPPAQYKLDGAETQAYAGAAALPVIEYNDNSGANDDSTKFYDSVKPVHSYQAAIMYQQGLLDDVTRGPISSNAQRESPSRVFGISSPGAPIYDGLKNDGAENALDSGAVSPASLRVVGRQGGHTMVMDDGDLNNDTRLFRLRSSEGHQIMMNDTDNFLHIITKAGDCWLEMNSEGALDIYATNSINLRTKGSINLHADKNINMYAGGEIQMYSKSNMRLETAAELSLRATADIKQYSQASVRIRADGTLELDAGGKGSWKCGGELRLDAAKIGLNSGGSVAVSPVTALTQNSLPETEFENGWVIKQGALSSICTRAPTHEPYPLHNTGV